MKKKKSEVVYSWKHFTALDLAGVGHYKALNFNLKLLEKTIVIGNTKNNNFGAEILLRTLIKSADWEYQLSHLCLLIKYWIY